MVSASLIGRRIEEAHAAGFHTPLPIPELVDAAKQANAVRLKIASARHAFVNGKPAKTYGYSAPILGPVVRVRNGDDVEMTIENALDRDTTVHWHGLSVPGDLDGGRTRSSSRKVHGVRCSKSTSRRPPPGFIRTRTMTPPDRFIWVWQE
jgi:FtsP/CotA-like multicopper oxidase with cupredoxin domain